LTNTASHPPLAGQVAVITGAGRGIGQAIAVTLAELGAHTVLCGRSRAALEQTAAAIQTSGTRSPPQKDSPSAMSGPRRSRPPSATAASPYPQAAIPPQSWWT